MISSGLSLTSLDMSGFVDTEERERESYFYFLVEAFRLFGFFKTIYLI
jgi:hypothetical protein